MRLWLLLFYSFSHFGCFTHATILWENVCRRQDDNNNVWPFCNTSLSIQTRVLDYSHRIPTQQKIQMMIDRAASYPKLHIPQYHWWSEGLHGALQPCVCSRSSKSSKKKTTSRTSLSNNKKSTSNTSATTTTWWWPFFTAMTTTTTRRTTKSTTTTTSSYAPTLHPPPQLEQESSWRTTTTCRCPTSFPCPSGLGNALNHTLWRWMGATIGRQARAITNLRNHTLPNNNNMEYYDGLTYWSPTINLQRDPRWGRNLEVPGEDPLVVSNYAKEFVQGLQYGITNNPNTATTTTTTDNHKNKNKILQVAACCKHFLANSLEGNYDAKHSNTSRHNFNAILSPDDLANYYLPPFQSCIEQGHALGVMCSYNAVNGLPSCTNTALLQTLLRDTWNFTGYVVSDCGAIEDVVNGHHIGNNMTVAVALALQAGTDLNCGDMYTQYLPQALQSKLISKAHIDTAFERLVTVQMKLGLFDHHHSKKNDIPQEDMDDDDDNVHNNHDQQQQEQRHPFLQYGINDIDTEQDQQLALEAAQQSIVLLQNDNFPRQSDSGSDTTNTPPQPVLPLQAPISQIAVIGPHIHAREVFLSTYHGERCLYGRFDCIPTPLDAIREANRGGTTVSAIGCHVQQTDWNNIDHAVELAQQSNVVILFLGIDTSVEGEGNDRIETTLPGLQLSLLDQILDGVNTTSTRLVVVLLHGGSISLGHDRLQRIPALLSAPYGGQAAAQAMANILFGLYNPTAKLVATFYPENYVHQIPITEMGLQVGVGRTHMYYKKDDAEFTFGHGLSYSHWTLDWHRSNGNHPTKPFYYDTAGPSLVVKLSLTNQGPLPGAQNVLLLWRRNKVDLSIRQKLIDYQGCDILPVGETCWVSFTIDVQAMQVANISGDYVVTPGIYSLIALSAGVSIEIDLVVAVDTATNDWESI